MAFAIENQPPPANLRVQGENLVWDAATDNAGVLGYLISVDGEPYARTPANLTTAPLVFCDDPVTPTFCVPSAGEPHTYVVRARDTSRNVGPPSEPLVVPAG